MLYSAKKKLFLIMMPSCDVKQIPLASFLMPLLVLLVTWLLSYFIQSLIIYLKSEIYKSTPAKKSNSKASIFRKARASYQTSFG